MEVPPLLINGSGKPITGTRPETIAILMNTYRKNCGSEILTKKKDEYIQKKLWF